MSRAAPQTVTIYGTGEGPTASLSKSSLMFGNQAMGSTSAPQTLTLSNAGNESLSISSIGLAGASPGDFAQSNNCGSSVAPEITCTISVTAVLRWRWLKSDLLSQPFHDTTFADFAPEIALPTER